MPIMYFVDQQLYLKAVTERLGKRVCVGMQYPKFLLMFKDVVCTCVLLQAVMLTVIFCNSLFIRCFRSMINISLGRNDGFGMYLYSKYSLLLLRSSYLRIHVAKTMKIYLIYLKLIPNFWTGTGFLVGRNGRMNGQTESGIAKVAVY